jgi:outer membrane protein, multidrug efflux system
MKLLSPKGHKKITTMHIKRSQNSNIVEFTHSDRRSEGMLRQDRSLIVVISTICLIVLFPSCAPTLVTKEANKSVPASYKSSNDTTNSSTINWKEYFNDSNLISLIDTALRNNQDINYVIQEIIIAQNEIRARKGAYLPFIGIGVGAGVGKVGTYTSQGASDAVDNITPGNIVPNILGNYILGLNASWEIDIWKKLRNAKKAAVYRYLSTQEGKKFMVTNLIANIANAYYELMALDNQLQILKQNIEIQTNALEIVRLEKVSARVTELAVRRFEAEVFKNQSHQFAIEQQIIEMENSINFLAGRFPQPVSRNSQGFANLKPDTIHAGIPTQLLENRTDIKQAELALEAAKLDVKSAKANFYPSLMITAAAGYQAFNPQYLITTPESMIYSLAGGLVAPFINRNAIKANYYSTNARQIQAVYMYQRAILTAHIEVVNQLANIGNLEKSYALQVKQVEALTESINISTGLFRSARATYMEVLLTQRDALESRFELTETKKQQMNAKVNIYRALGGGWR